MSTWPAHMGAQPASDIAAEASHAAFMHRIDSLRMDGMTRAFEYFATMRNIGPSELAHVLTLARRIAALTQTEQKTDMLKHLDHCIQQMHDEAEPISLDTMRFSGAI